ncbi:MULTISPECIES: 16S rRNA (guanine(527)-N(7))-methyltransferase RsmG [Variovorax]|jgi:16S rRNA (guanine527-N7)-methyltransferase|uniref:16S rRNA (guanine(527)-N(7))-methyltransferase RsmG n=1 Tax=Variovorax TaxID=34072 RepID=UPI00086B9A67|nr:MULTISPECIES: 16S rRNA (guanine(527)-N(7))-methyltransferase RsmG [Variovorax]MBN8755294.1 16S rRNA (guanine(527)-N(7))-methyltransferase RsmG [Variovorax sp.]ODU15955.1 MAG: 16S rRNA (guanine(527)-N(7))-methyltransferase [Variovorax sp. SCN 67-85]ODV21286.1 MAG: 16S rRNA (guanine(527)-N(7))-methyltransferase [Variovorax sp. SCN 67-20]OJZ14153.1 MAG: 16S rRNA (guanine(527)-N(7))-methyltransferase RsmG [Variovorax sp. 67-131]UKI08448.1 16S rRNA (guanine(527)-N(7))-methyltransferase RsmG [Var
MTAPIDTLRAGAAAMGVALSDQQGEQLLAYGTLMLKWNKVYNLTALRDPASVLTHHLLDSLAAIAPLQREWAGKGKLLDVGSGGGLPGVVIAIMRPDIDVSCLDAVAKKAAFVQQVAAELELPNLRGLHARVESLTGSYDVISSRAFASLPDFFNGSVHLLAPGAVWLAMKGKVPADELAALPKGVAVFHVEQLTVPGLGAERCIVWARNESA